MEIDLKALKSTVLVQADGQLCHDRSDESIVLALERPELVARETCDRIFWRATVAEESPWGYLQEEDFWEAVKLG